MSVDRTQCEVGHYNYRDMSDTLYSVGVMSWSVLLMEFSLARAVELRRWWRGANGMQEPTPFWYRAEDDMNLDGCSTR